MTSWKPLLCGAALAATSMSLAAQQPTFKAGAKVVSIFATVTDADKRLVPGLTKDDFEVYDNEKLQPLVTFDNRVREINVVVMLDTSGSMTLTIDLLKQAAEQFLIRLMPADRARVGAFNDKIQFNSRWSSDRDQLITDVRDLDFGNGTRLWDAVGASLDELRPVEGRKVILMFTDGDDTGSRLRMGAVMDLARSEDVMVYAIGLESDYFDGERRVRTRPDPGLRKIAEETGGGYFELKRATELAPTFTRIAQELHSQYVLGFEPTQLDNKVHKLSVKVKQPTSTTRARKTYLAAPEKAAP